MGRTLPPHPAAAPSPCETAVTPPQAPPSRVYRLPRLAFMRWMVDFLLGRP
ncbi:unnamed protein product, partial [marine sediment metagenome]